MGKHSSSFSHGVTAPTRNPSIVGPHRYKITVETALGGKIQHIVKAFDRSEASSRGELAHPGGKTVECKKLAGAVLEDAE